MPPQYKNTSFKLDIPKLVPKSVCVRQISPFFQKIYNSDSSLQNSLNKMRLGLLQSYKVKLWQLKSICRAYRQIAWRQEERGIFYPGGKMVRASA